MEKTVAVVQAPVTFLDTTGKQVSVEPTAFWFEGAELKVDASKLPVNAGPWVEGWLKYLARTGVIVAAPPDTSPSKPAMVFQARAPGSAGNDVSLEVTYAEPPTSFTLQATQTNVYEALTIETLSAVLGTAQKAGTRPGLVRLKDAPVAPPKAQTGTLVGADATSRGTWAAAASSGTAFTLEATEPGTETIHVEVSGPAPGQAGQPFTLTVKWTKSVSNLTANNLSTELAQFGHVLTASPPVGGFKLPRGGTFKLLGGVDSTYASLAAAPKPA